MSNNVAISGNNANSLTLFGGRVHNLFNTPTKPRLFSNSMLKLSGLFFAYFLLGLDRLSASFTRVVVPLTKPKLAGPQATAQAESVEEQVLVFCQQPKSRQEIQDYLGLKHREHFRKMILNPLLDSGQLLRTLPDKPTSQKQQFYSATHQEHHHDQ